jgi:hypothetical protein
MRAYTAHATCEHQHHEIVEHLFLSINASNRGKTAEWDSDLTSYHNAHKDTKTYKQTSYLIVATSPSRVRKCLHSWRHYGRDGRSVNRGLGTMVDHCVRMTR